MKTIYKKSLMRDTGTIIFSSNLDISSVSILVVREEDPQEPRIKGKLHTSGIIVWNTIPDKIKEPFNIVFLTYCPMCNKSYKAELLDVIMVDEQIEDHIIKKNCMARAWVPWEEYVLGCGVCAH